MRRVVLLAVFVTCQILAAFAACQIPGDRFFKPGLDGATDGLGDSLPPPMSRYGYIVDNTTGIFKVDKDPTTGVLTIAGSGSGSGSGGTPVTPVISGSGFYGALVNARRNFLFAFDVNLGLIRQFAIASDGSLTGTGNVSIPGCSVPRFAARHPNGNYFVVACSDANFVVVSLGSNGEARSANVITTSGSTLVHAAFANNGTCLFLTDLFGQAGNWIQTFTFDPGTGATTFVGTNDGPASPRGIATHPNGRYVYVVGTGGSSPGIQSYTAPTSVVPIVCALGPNGPSQLVGGGSEHVVVDPGGRYVFVAGNQVDAFHVTTDGTLSPVNGTPFFKESGITIDGALIDPSAPDILYLTGGLYGGTFPAPIATDGSLSMGVTAVTGAGGSYWFEVGP